MIGVLAQTFNQPTLDYHALAPEIVLGGVVVLVLLVDLFLDETREVGAVVDRRSRRAGRLHPDRHARPV